MGRKLINIAITNIKGGVGKTCSTVNLGATLSAYHKKKVLIIDCDAQSNSTDYLLINNERATSENIKTVLEGVKIEKAIQTVNFTTPRKKKFSLDLICGSMNSGMIESPTPDLLKKKLKSISDRYDICLFDCPPDTSSLAILALCASDFILVPAIADSFSLSGYSALIDIVNNIKAGTDNTSLCLLGIFFNAFAPQRSLSKIIKRETEAGFSDMLFDVAVCNYAMVSNAAYMGYPVCCFPDPNPVNENYKAIAKKILARIKKIRGNKL